MYEEYGLKSHSYIHAIEGKEKWELGLTLETFQNMLIFADKLGFGRHSAKFEFEREKLRRGKPLCIYRNEKNGYRLVFESGSLVQILPI